jgi:hypothetical protein
VRHEKKKIPWRGFWGTISARKIFFAGRKKLFFSGHRFSQMIFFRLHAANRFRGDNAEFALHFFSVCGYKAVSQSPFSWNH